MRPRDKARARKLDSALVAFHTHHPLPGIAHAARREALVEQLVESMRRIEYVRGLAKRDVNSLRADATSELFDPIKAAEWYKRQGNLDEAFWLVFLSVHFGKNLRTGWNLVRAVYGALGGTPWTWDRVSNDPAAMVRWIGKNRAILKGEGPFGNHRKYVSLNVNASNQTGDAITSYVAWVNPPRSHAQLVKDTENAVAPDPRRVFVICPHSWYQVL